MTVAQLFTWTHSYRPHIYKHSYLPLHNQTFTQVEIHRVHFSVVYLGSRKGEAKLGGGGLSHLLIYLATV